ncbi:MAG: hypothetical protein O2783_07285 [Chloroflexi bacterium]|nr:hypothetical protein [Chloroflexota bacterium]
MPHGVTVKEDVGSTRVEIQCAHQSGLIYVVPAEASWVCQPEHIHAHALAGFFRELMELTDPRITELMQRWGMYYRSRPLDTQEEQA